MGPRLHACYGLLVLIGARQSLALNLHIRTSTPWIDCGNEGEHIFAAGGDYGETRLVRFGWGQTWLQGRVALGSLCSKDAFGGQDPLPDVRKACQCLSSQASASASQVDAVTELGTAWTQCAEEGALCQCASGVVRFGTTSRWAQLASAGQSTSVQCVADTSVGDPAPGQAKQCWCRGEQDQKDEARVGIVLLSRRPVDLSMWLQYHIRYMGIEHIFMQVEDSPEFNGTWNSMSAALQSHVTVWHATGEGFGPDQRPFNDYETLQDRQMSAMGRAKELSQQMGLHWLLHIDDDELLYTPLHQRMGELLAEVPPNTEQVYIPNVEAVYDSADVQHCFTETTEVNMNAYKFASYANGKAAVRVSSDAVAAGPHQWRNSLGMELVSFHLESSSFGSPLLLVHYESCPFTRWEEKFWELGNTTPERVSAIPFPFYKDSIKRMQQCRGLGHGLAALLEGRVGRRSNLTPDEADCSQQSLKQLWSSYKSRANSALAPQDLMQVSIPWKEILAMQ
mmetsp:Transcript_25431/g.59192  ORF Transcript_25431/g.59192 Transcript_25431/m.59192 type:complete len:508 (-) Transcript_25431:50-1573(-)